MRAQKKVYNGIWAPRFLIYTNQRHLTVFILVVAIHTPLQIQGDLKARKPT